MAHFPSHVPPQNVVFLAGAPRSGTTWLSNIINYRNDFRYMFEPFNHERVALCRQFNFRQYLRPEDRNPAYLLPAARIFAGKIRHPWVDQQNRKPIYDRLLIKDVRSNLMLPWLKKCFPAARFILLVRHPCAVVASRAKFYKWKANLSAILSQDQLVTDYLRKYAACIREVQGRFDEDVYLWCIDHYVALQQIEGRDIHLVFYEHLCTDPESEIDRLSRFLGIAFDDGVEQVIRKPSLLTWADDKARGIRKGVRIVDSWCDRIASHQLARAMEIVREFGLDVYYGADPMPRIPIPADGAPDPALARA